MRRLGILALVTLILTVIWLIMLIIQMADTGSIDNYDEALAYAHDLNPGHYLIYLTTGLLTAVNVALFAQLYNVYKSDAPEWSLVGFAFVPIYGAMNLSVYLSQVAVLPRLADAPADRGEALLAYSVQLWPDSPVAFVNLLAYTVLAIPSVIFGALMMRQGGAMRVAGVLLVSSGVLSVVTLVDILAQVGSPASIISGALFLMALISLSWASLRPGLIKEQATS